MVVLSSCTNYDDQFDDLNSQLNTLKTQIDGFTAVSSGVTALQGTVTSLQAAVAALPKSTTPATDISGLQTALTALAATVAELKTSLATAATAADVAALTASLTKVQTDLSELLAANNVYTPDASLGLVINSAASLSVAEALGSRLGIVNGKVTITHNAAASMDAAKLQAVVDKFITITGKLDYTHGGTSVSGVNFNNLTGTGDLDLDQEAPISLPKLASAADVDFTSDLKVTSVSAPALTKVTSLATMNFTQATSISMPAFKGETGDAVLSITAKSKSTIDLSAYDTKSETSLLEVTHTLTINGPASVTLPLFVTGVLTTDAEVITLVGAKSAPVTTAANLKEIHLHNLQGVISLGTTYAKLSIVDIIGTYETAGVAATVSGKRLTDVTLGSAGIETLTLAGALGAVSITNASSLSSVTTSGGMRSFSLAGATDLTALTLGHGANASSTLKLSNLVVTGATSLVTLKADSINNASTVTIEDNTSLTSISMAGLSAIGTETASESVSIKNNSLIAQSFQLPSASGDTPVVAGKITSNSGLGSLQAYLDVVVATSASTAYVEYDDVLKATSAGGLVYEVGGSNGTSASVTYATGKSVSVETAANTAFVAINISADSRVYSTARKQTNTMVMTTPADTKLNGTTSVFTFNAAGAGESAITVAADAGFQGGISGFNSTDVSTWLPEVISAMQTKISAAGYNYSLTAANDYGATAAYTVNLLSTSGSAANGALSTSGVIFVKVGNTTFVTATLAANDDDGLGDAIVAAITNGALSRTFSASNALNNNVITLIKQTSSSNSAQDLVYTAFPDMTFGGYTTSTSTSAVPMSYTLIQNKAITKGWRVTGVNNSFTVKGDNLEANQFFFSDTAGGENITFTAVGTVGQYATSTSTLQVNWANKAESTVTSGVVSETTDFTAWM
jgi:hypothetical protein